MRTKITQVTGAMFTKVVFGTFIVVIVSLNLSGYRLFAQTPPAVGSGSLTLTTTKNVGDKIRLGIQAKGDITIEGVQEPPKIGGFPSVEYTLTSQTLTIRGDITFLRCNSMGIQTLSLTNCPELTELYCLGNGLTSIDLAHCPKLHTLWCNNNKLTALDLSKAPALRVVQCYNNTISNLNLSYNPSLELLSCYSNNLETLDLNKCPKLQKLECNQNEIARLDLSSCEELESVLCNNNKLNTLTFREESPKLRILTCHDNELQSLMIGHVPELEGIYCYNNQITEIAFTAGSKLTAVVFFNNRIRGEKMIQLVKNLPDKKNEYSSGNLVVHATAETRPQDGNLCLKSDVTAAKLKNWNTCYYGGGSDYIPYEGEELAGNYTENIALKTKSNELSLTIGAPSEEVYINWGDGKWMKTAVSERGTVINGQVIGNQVTISGKDVTRLLCTNNEITELILKDVPELKVLHCFSNELTHIDLSKTPKIEELYLQDNAFKQIELVALPHLKDLNIANNQLKSISLEANQELVSLSLLGNELTSIDLSHCPKLEDISLGYNHLTELNVKGNSQLFWIIIYKNNLSEEALKDLFESLPTRANNDGTIKVFQSKDDEIPEGNRLTPADITIATKKGWKVLDGKEAILAIPEVSKERLYDEVQIQKSDTGIIILAPYSCRIYSIEGNYLGNTTIPSDHLNKTQYPSIILLATPGGDVRKVLL